MIDQSGFDEKVMSSMTANVVSSQSTVPAGFINSPTVRNVAKGAAERHLKLIISDTMKAQRRYVRAFQKLLDQLAGTKRPTVHENRELLHLVRTAARRLNLALCYGKGNAERIVTLNLSSAKGAIVGTFQVFTPGGQNRTYFYNGAALAALHAHDAGDGSRLGRRSSSHA